MPIKKFKGGVCQCCSQMLFPILFGRGEAPLTTTNKGPEQALYLEKRRQQKASELSQGIRRYGLCSPHRLSMEGSPQRGIWQSQVHPGLLSTVGIGRSISDHVASRVGGIG
jgi:hypothetical protein